jgi:hypothetical protein
MRLLEFLPDGETLNVFTYSPLYDKLLQETAPSYVLKLD